MKKLFLLPLLMTLFLSSCEEEEGCDATIAAQRSGVIYCSLWIKDQNGNGIANYPTKISAQKYWCEGDFAIIASNSGTTDFGGYFIATSPQYDLNNEGDYVLITFEAGVGNDKQEVSTRVYYSDFTLYNVNAYHVFTVMQ